MPTKLIVTNRSRLTAKYGAAGLRSVEGAIAALTRADKKRGLITVLEYLDAPTRANASALKAAMDRRGVKRAIDALFEAYEEPDYLLLLGAPDVIPFQTFKNPVPRDDDPEESDPDEFVESDLPYACDAPFSTSLTDFLGATRVVGRLPDVAGSRQVGDLVTLISLATGFRGTAGKQSFVVGADEWQGATRANAKLAFGKVPGIQLAPPNGPVWSPGRLQRPVHFINCHGARKDPSYYGSSPDYPLAHEPAGVRGHVTSGSLVVAECCYGAEIYAPTRHRPMGLAMTYLLSGAAAYVGSTTTSYGDGTAAGRCCADLVCTDFLGSVFKNASVGRAFLEARQQFLKKELAPSPFDLKTIAQFVLLGDPSLRPYGGAAASPRRGPKRKAATSVGSPVSAPGDRGGHVERRAALKASGMALQSSTPAPMESPRPLPSDMVTQILDLAGVKGAAGPSYGYRVAAQGKADGARRSAAKRLGRPGDAARDSWGTAVQVIFLRNAQAKKTKQSGALKIGTKAKPSVARRVESGRPDFKIVRAVVARTRDGQIVSTQMVESK